MTINLFLDNELEGGNYEGLYDFYLDYLELYKTLSILDLYIDYIFLVVPYIDY